MSNNESPFISAALRGKTRRIALWPHGEPTAGALRDVHAIAKHAGMTVEAYDRARAFVASDERLSDVARRDDTKKAALTHLSTLANVQANLRGQVAALENRRRALLEVKPYAPNDFAAVAIDIALAQKLSTMDEAGRMRAASSDPRVAEVVMRLPSTLTGVAEGAKSRLVADAARQRNPEEARELETLSEALEHATEGVHNAARAIAEDVHLTREEFAPYAHIGTTIGDAA